MKKVLMICLLAACLLVPMNLLAEDAAPAPQATQQYERPSVGIMLLDGLLVRPLACTGAIISTAFCSCPSTRRFYSL